ncbi:Ferredoxin, 2Fe-2S [Sphingobium indicum BiD32]|uniref:Ferredoxin, 2Fe-2S n=1 Tax=Sphingobium indicum BiD32 TaxID=1301087 RepID=N1MLV7_9SPHN|nr:2Fe-2S iron-sulfur cluster-binding protein [Sphingobium indicum]CCW16473.1 Ferredoxin, 2Fe-2S [Sphingobium indicum BiD32]
MVQVTFVDVNGVERRVDGGSEDQSLMELAKANGIDGIAADCGGACSCATCLVHIDPDWTERTGQPDDIEFAMLDMVADVATVSSRLACQIRLSGALDGLRVVVAQQ